MATESINHASTYSRVSSLYGPGTIACWYLTILSCLVSWTLHPKKRRSDSISSDFIAVLVLPAVAASHTTVQIHAYPGPKSDMMITDDPDLLELIAAIEASLIVTEAFMAISVILFLVSAGFQCVKRACAVALTGLLCFATEEYVYFSVKNLENSKGNFSRLFVVNFGGFLTVILVVLILCAAATLGLVWLFFSRPMELDPSLDREATAIFAESRQATYITNISMIFLPLLGVTTMLPSLIGILSVLPPELGARLKAIPIHILRSNFPRTTLSIKDLDQSVASLAGATVLGFSLYSAADAYYQRWWRSAQVRAQERIELIALRRRRFEV